ncbi:MAG: chromosome segregation protein ParM [Actinomycetota bacterium]
MTTNKQLGTNPSILTRQAVNSPKTILSADLGRTATKACVNRNPNNVVFMPANVAKETVEKVRGGSFESKATDPLLDLWLEYQGNGYAIGQLAADFGASLGAANQSKVEDALVKVLACVGYFQMKGELAVVLGLPFYSQEQFEKEKQQITDQLRSPHVMMYRGERVEIDIRHVWVMPEGFGSLIWCEAQDSKEFTPELPELSVAVVDIGHQTTDLLMVDRFRFARAASKSDSFAMNKFYEQVAEQVAAKSGGKADAQSLSLLEAVHKPEGKRLYRPKGSTKPVNLDEILPAMRKGFATELSERLVEWLPERVTDVVLTGGGGEFFWDVLKPLIEEAGLKPHLAQPSRKANALGQYVYGEAQLATVR